MDWTLPINLSAQGGSIDDLYYVILVITGIAFVLVEAGILWFVFRYRNREGRGALYSHGDNRLEVVWTVIPAVVMVWLGIHSGQIWSGLKQPKAFPDPSEAVTLDVTAQQFEWMITYPGADGELETEDDFTVRNHLHLPVDQKVIVRLRSEDVIHSFFLPFLRVKQDVVPGMTHRAWFEATEPGTLELACAELCGLGHFRMRAQVTVHEAGGFERWQQQEARRRAGERDAGRMASR